MSAQSSIPINPTHFPDSAFRKFVEQYDSDKDGQLSQTECQIKRINCSQRGIYSLEGIQYFTHLEILVCRQNQISQLDLSGCPDLVLLDCSDNDFAQLELSNTPNIEDLSCTRNHLASLDLSGCPDLTELDCNSNHLTSLNLSGCSNLNELDCNNNYLHQLDLSGCPNLTELKCYNNHLSSLDLSNTTKLETLDCTFNPLTYLDLSHTPDLSSLSCIETRLVSLDLSHTPKLTRMDCFYNWHPLTLDEKNRVDIALLPGFDPERASNFEGATLDGNHITFFQQEITYSYATGFPSNDSNFQSVTFTLYADPAPSVDNETSDNARQGRVYAKDRTLYTEGIEGMVSVFNPAGGLVYQGSQNRIPVNSPGIYILRHGNQTWKIFVM